MKRLIHEWRNVVRLTLGLIFASGGYLFWDHIAHYGLAFHSGVPVDHGLWGLIMIVGSVGAALIIFRWRPGRKK